MHCLICKEKAKEHLDGKLNIKTYKCSNCAFIFKDPTLFASLNEQKKRYDLHQNDSDNAGYRDYFQGFLDYVLPLVNDTGSALDFGCGRSVLLSDMMSENGIVSDYYDPIYHENSNHAEKKYDLITSVEVFEHLHDPVQVFSELLSLLNDNGYLAIRTEFAPMRMADYFSWYYRQDPTHVGFFSIDTFKYMSRELECFYVEDNGKNIVILKR